VSTQAFTQRLSTTAHSAHLDRARLPRGLKDLCAQDASIVMSEEPTTPWGVISIESSARLGQHRWVVERTVSWLSACRRLHRRYERKAEHFLTFVDIAVTLICLCGAEIAPSAVELDFDGDLRQRGGTR
jgi:hypothetical protein